MTCARGKRCATCTLPGKPGCLGNGRGWPGAGRPSKSAVSGGLPAIFKANHLPYGFGTSLYHVFANFETCFEISIFDTAKLITGGNAPSSCAVDVLYPICSLHWLPLAGVLVSIRVGGMAHWENPFLWQLTPNRLLVPSRLSMLWVHSLVASPGKTGKDPCLPEASGYNAD